MVKTPFLTRFSVECCHSKAIFTPLLSLCRKFLAETGSNPEVPGKLVYSERVNYLIHEQWQLPKSGGDAHACYRPLFLVDSRLF